MNLSDNTKIGVGLTFFGTICTLLGVLLLFDRALLALGNLSFLAGVTLIMGFAKTKRYLFQQTGTICFLGGILIILFGWTFIGMIIEIFGFINLFGNFFPIAIGFLQRMPVIGHILELPVISKIVDKIAGVQSQV